MTPANPPTPPPDDALERLMQRFAELVRKESRMMYGDTPYYDLSDELIEVGSALLDALSAARTREASARAAIAALHSQADAREHRRNFDMSADAILERDYDYVAMKTLRAAARAVERALVVPPAPPDDEGDGTLPSD